MDPLIPPSLSFTMPDGYMLPARSWLPPQGTAWQGVILALHGYTDSRDGFEIAGPVFAAAGYAVFAPDQRGFGGTATRGDWPGSERLVDDAAALVAQLRARFPGQPVVLLGESMGGAVAALLAAGDRPAANAYVLMAPAVWGWPQLATPLDVLLRLTYAFAPHWSPDPGHAPIDVPASDNIPALLRFGHDPLTLRRPSIAMTKGLVDLMTSAQAAMPRLHGSVLIASGQRDHIVPAHAAAAAWAKLLPAVRRAFYPNGYHLLLRDKDRALVQADILSWLHHPNAWLPSGADAAAAAWVASAPYHARVSELAPAYSWDGFWQESLLPY